MQINSTGEFCVIEAWEASYTRGADQCEGLDQFEDAGK